MGQLFLGAFRLFLHFGPVVDVTPHSPLWPLPASLRRAVCVLQMLAECVDGWARGMGGTKPSDAAAPCPSCGLLPRSHSLSVAFLRLLCRFSFSSPSSLSLSLENKNYWTWHYLLVSMVIKSVSDNGPSLAVVSFGNFSNTVAQATCISIPCKLDSTAAFRLNRSKEKCLL